MGRAWFAAGLVACVIGAAFAVYSRAEWTTYAWFSLTAVVVTVALARSLTKPRESRNAAAEALNTYNNLYLGRPDTGGPHPQHSHSLQVAPPADDLADGRISVPIRVGGEN